MFSFHLYYFSFYLRFRLVRKLVFLYFNVNVYQMEIPCLNKVTLPYLYPFTSHLVVSVTLSNTIKNTLMAIPLDLPEALAVIPSSGTVYVELSAPSQIKI